MSISPICNICIGVKTYKINAHRWICTPNTKVQNPSVAFCGLVTPPVCEQVWSPGGPVPSACWKKRKGEPTKCRTILLFSLDLPLYSSWQCIRSTGLLLDNTQYNRSFFLWTVETGFDNGTWAPLTYLGRAAACQVFTFKQLFIAALIRIEESDHKALFHKNFWWGRSKNLLNGINFCVWM